MTKITEIATLVSGTSQFRIRESFESDAPEFFFYGQNELEDDLVGSVTHGNKKRIKTHDSITVLSSGDVVLSLITAKAAIVRNVHDGYLLTQNFLKLVPSSKIEAKYLVYVINEALSIKQQLQAGQQGSTTLKYTVKQFRNLRLPPLPSKELQVTAGEVYFNQLRLEALKKRVTHLETTLVLEKIRRALGHE